MQGVAPSLVFCALPFSQDASNGGIARTSGGVPSSRGCPNGTEGCAARKCSCADRRQAKLVSPVRAPPNSSRHLVAWKNAIAKSASRHAVLSILRTALIVYVATVRAREPGQADSFPPGGTLGLSVAENPPPGVYIFNQASYSDAWVTDAGTTFESGPRVRVGAESVKLIWSTPWEIFGAKELMFIIQPYVHVKLSDFPELGNQTRQSGNFANTGFEPINLSWNLGTDLYGSLHFGFYAPALNYSQTSGINAGNNFWTLEPEAAFSYVGHGCNLTLHLVYTTNTKNPSTDYRSGDQIVLDITATQTLRRTEVGLVGYLSDQVTADKNGGKFYANDLPQTEPFRFALGPLVGYFLGRYHIQAYFTRDLIARDGAEKGNHVWTNITLPF